MSPVKPTRSICIIIKGGPIFWNQAFTVAMRIFDYHLSAPLNWISIQFINVEFRGWNSAALCIPAHCLKIAQNVAFTFLSFGIFHQFLSYLKVTCLVTLFDRKLQVFKNFQNVNIARFACNVKCDFFCDFQTPCLLGGFPVYKSFLASKSLFVKLF